jgi:hypothetical protein
VLVGGNAREHEHACADDAACVCRAGVWPGVTASQLTVLLDSLCCTLMQLTAPSLTDAEHDGVEGPKALAQLIFGAGAVQLFLGILGLY